MEDAVKLKAQKRQDAGTKVTRRLRQEGYLPVVLYGHKQETVPLRVNMHDFVEGLHHGHRLFEVELDGTKQTTMIKELQYDYLGRDVIHADLIRVDITERVTVSVPVELKGEAVGADAEGAMTQQHIDTVEIECQVNNIPDVLTLRIHELDVNDSLFVRDLALPEGVDVVTDPDTCIVTCSIIEEAPTTEELEEEEPAAPEVIGEEKEPTEEGEEGAAEKEASQQ